MTGRFFCTHTSKVDRRAARALVDRVGLAALPGRPRRGSSPSLVDPRFAPSLGEPAAAGCQRNHWVTWLPTVHLDPPRSGVLERAKRATRIDPRASGPDGSGATEGRPSTCPAEASILALPAN